MHQRWGVSVGLSPESTTGGFSPRKSRSLAFTAHFEALQACFLTSSSSYPATRPLIRLLWTIRPCIVRSPSSDHIYPSLPFLLIASFVFIRVLPSSSSSDQICLPLHLLFFASHCVHLAFCQTRLLAHASNRSRGPHEHSSGACQQAGVGSTGFSDQTLRRHRNDALAAAKKSPCSSPPFRENFQTGPQQALSRKLAHPITPHKNY